MNEPQTDLLRLAQRAFSLQTRAMNAKHEKGIDDFLAVIDDNIEWRVPAGRFAGSHKGKASFEEFFRYACSYYPTGLTFYIDHVGSDNRNTVIFEFRDQGLTRDGKAYRASVVISYTMRHDKIISYREYSG